MIRTKVYDQWTADPANNMGTFIENIWILLINIREIARKESSLEL